MYRSRHLEERQGERGTVVLVVALGLVALMGISALAVDYGYLEMKKTQLQAAADAASMAGATALVSYGADLEQVRAVVRNYAAKNLSGQDNPEQAVGGGDIRFYLDGVPNTVSPNQVEVTVGRTAARGNPVQLFLARAVGVAQADVTATARAAAYAVPNSRCLLPLAIAAKFTWDDGCDPDPKLNGNGEMDVDSECEFASVEVSGYGPEDVGTLLTLKYGDPENTMAPGQYNAVDYPPVNKGTPMTGGDQYRDNFVSCLGSNDVLVENGDELQLEPGNMTGPTKQGVDDLMNEDPTAYWDAGDNSIKNSQAGDPLASPRVGLISFYDPRFPPEQGRNNIVVHGLGAVFLEGMNGGDVQARFVESMAVRPEGSGGTGLLYNIRLVRDSTR